MNIKVMPLESLRDIILILLHALLLPLGIWILFNLEDVAKKWYELSKKKATSEYKYFLGFSMRGYTLVSWNKIIFRLMGQPY